MRLPVALLPLLAAACAQPADPLGDDDGTGPGDDDTTEGPGDDDTTEGPGDDDAGPTDADGDGSIAGEDCDDGDPAVYPGAAETCDGADQDCDGLVDEGVPGDGAGCLEPPPPAWDDAVGIVHITSRAGTGTYDGTDEFAEVCLSATDCFPLDKPDWNDNEPGVIDVWAYEGVALSRASLDRFTVRVDDGSDLWRPTCFAVSLDGEAVYCRDGLDLDIGSDSGEVASWTDPEGLTAACLGCFDSPLTHGPLLGAMGEDTARFWVRADATRRVAFRVAATDEALQDAAPVHVAWPTAASDFTAVAEVVGLAPGTTWSYDVEVEGRRIGPLRFTTAPSAGPAAPGGLSFAFGSCSKDEDQPVFGAIAAGAPDLFLFIGDNHYANSEDLSTLRQNYRFAHERPLRRDLLASVPILATWDDHDFTGNNEDGTAAGRDVALRAFREYWANPASGTPETPGTFFRHRVADAEFFVLDDRTWRGLDGTLLGEAQAEWLVDALAASDANWKFVASGSQFTQQGSDDSWATFPDAWDDFRASLGELAITGVVLLSGDVHRSEFRVLPGGAAGYDLPEITSSPLANTNSPCQWEDEVLDCFDTGDYFVRIDLAGAGIEATLTATIVEDTGEELAAWTISRSGLEP